MDLAPGVSEDTIKRVINDVARAKKNRVDHKILSELTKWDELVRQRANEPDQKIELVRKSTTRPDYQKLMVTLDNDMKKIANFKSHDAKIFYQTFWSGNTRKYLDTDQVFNNFALYFHQRTGRIIEDSSFNRGVFNDGLD